MNIDTEYNNVNWIRLLRLKEGEPEEDEDIEEPIEKGIIRTIGNFAQRAIQIFEGKPGFWITRFGRRIFVTEKEAQRATTFLNIASDAKPRASFLKGLNEAIDELHPSVTESISRINVIQDVKSLPESMHGDLVTDVAAFFTTQNKEMTFFADTIDRMLKLNPKMSEEAQAKLIRSTFNHEAGHAFFDVHMIKTDGHDFIWNPTNVLLTRKFMGASFKEGGVTRYASSYITGDPKQKIKGINLSTLRFIKDAKEFEPYMLGKNADVFLYGTENFAELHMVYQNRLLTKYDVSDVWGKVQKLNPNTTEAFLEILNKVK